MTQILIAGWALRAALRDVLLGDMPAEPATIAGRLTERGPLAVPGLAPGGQTPALRLKPDTAAELAQIDWLRTGLGHIAQDGAEIIGIGGVADEAAPSWEISAEDEIILARALREFVPQAGQDLADAKPHFYGALARSFSRARAEADLRPGLPGTPSLDDVQIIAQEPADHGYFAVDHLRTRVPRFDGGLGPEIKRTTWRCCDAALVLPYDPISDRVLLIEQFRFGPLMRGDLNPWKLEPAAGHIDPGETAREAAAREMREEADLDPKELISVGAGYGSPGYVSVYFECFIAICDIPEQAGWVAGAQSEAEDIRSHSLTFDEAMAMLDEGALDVLPLATLLLWLARHRADLRAKARAAR